MPPPSEQVLARHRRILNRNRTLLAAQLAAIWDRLDSHDQPDIDDFDTRAAPLIDGATAATVASTTAFTALILDIPAPPVAPDAPVVFRSRDGFTAFWHALAEGRPYPEGLAAGRSAVQAAAANYLQSVARRSGDQVAQAADRTVRWRREAEPGACDWCKARDGNTYRTAATADFGHNRCFCDVIPDT